MAGLGAMLEKDASAPGIDRTIDLLFAQALIADGSPLEDPSAFVKELNALLAESVGRG